MLLTMREKTPIEAVQASSTDDSRWLMRTISLSSGVPMVEHEMELAPRPPLLLAVETHLPLALTVELDARRAHRQVRRPRAPSSRLHLNDARRRGYSYERGTVII